MKNIGQCGECGRKKYINEHGYCKKCFKTATNEDILVSEE